MKKSVGFTINTKLKEEYDECLIEEFGYKKNKCSSEIEKAIKLYMAMKGNEEYQKDPDVQAILKTAKKTYEKQSKTKIRSISNDIPLDERFEQIDEKLETMKEEIIAQLEKKTRRESSKKHGHAEFKKQFTMAFNDHKQVSRKDLERFIMNHSDIVDKRSVQSRIHYLESHGLLEIYAPNVYTLTC